MDWTVIAGLLVAATTFAVLGFPRRACRRSKAVAESDGGWSLWTSWGGSSDCGDGGGDCGGGD